jgi:heme/copper-type cytochrome/quinol oxidase subunit 3
MTDTTLYQQPLPVGSAGRRSSGWWGMLTLVVTEASLFAYLLFSYFYLASQAQGTWLPTDTPSLKLALPNTIILIASSFVLWWGERGIRRGQRMRLLVATGVTLVMGIVFATLQVMEWHNKPFSISDHAYGSLYYTVTGFHMAHVLGGLLILAALLLWAALGHFDERRHAAVSIGAIYWHFVDIVWLAVFSTFYLYPYLR